MRVLQQGSIAPVDLAQSAIGPGMALYSSYERVIEADGSPITVRSALTLINQVLDEALAEQEADFDPETRWAVAWFEQFGFDEGPYGSAETLSKAKNASLRRISDAAIADLRAGKVRLARTCDPATVDDSAPVWVLTHACATALESSGEAAAADVVRIAGADSHVLRELAYRLYGVCAQRGRAREASRYNALVVAWPEVHRLSEQTRPDPQPSLWTSS
jgi:putative DNA methylase